MIDSFDFKEPACKLCGGKEFYNPDQNAPSGRIPIARILEKTDESFNKKDYEEAKRLLEYWKNEAVSLKDKQGELTLQSELVGFYRKMLDKDNAYKAIDRAFELINALGVENSVSTATILLNIATAYKAFGEAEKAIPLFLQVETSYKQHFDNGNQQFGGLYNNMALAYVDLEQFEQAQIAYENAIKVMSKVPNGQTDLAITYVNLSYLYEKMEKDKKDVVDCLFKAFNLLNDENLPHDGYYAFVCEKCAPAFSDFGFDAVYQDLMRQAREIYERNRNI